MKTLKAILAAVAIAPMLTACLDDETTGSGFAGLSATVSYANSTNGYISFASMGNWELRQTSGSSWCSPVLTSGQGNMMYGIPVTLTQNTTGSARSANFTLADIDDADVYVNFVLRQYATRGDGTLGNAALVKTVTGDDGSDIAVTYDELCRPQTLNMSKNGTTLRSLTIYYSSEDTTMTVNDGGSMRHGVYGVDYQPTSLTSETDTIGYVEQYSFGNSFAFNIEERSRGGVYNAQSLLLVNQSLSPDSEHKADSLKYQHRYSDGTTYTEKLGLSYSKMGNRSQSLDVNQLLLGIEECNPYALLSFYKYARNSWIISQAKSADGTYAVEATTNSDGSVATMTVTDKRGGKVTYQFGY